MHHNFTLFIEIEKILYKNVICIKNISDLIMC